MSEDAKKIQNLDDKDLDSVVGGAVTGSYMTGLSDYIKDGRLSFEFGKFQGNSTSFSGFSSSTSMPAHDLVFALMISNAEKYGGVVMTSKSGERRRFSADELKKFL